MLQIYDFVDQKEEDCKEDVRINAVLNSFERWKTCTKDHLEDVTATRKFVAAHFTGKFCWHCGKRLHAIGVARENGNIDKNDWDTRKWHVKCFKKLYKEYSQPGWSLSQILDKEKEARKIIHTYEQEQSNGQ